MFSSPAGEKIPSPLEPVARDQILRRRERGQGNINFPCSADHEQDWQPYPVDPNSAISDDHTYIHVYIHTYINTYIHKYIHTPPTHPSITFFF